MDTVIFLLVLSSVTKLVVPDVTSLTSYRAVVEVVSGKSRIFSGENIKLRCSIPDNNRSSWSYLWFRGSEQLGQSGEHLVLWKARVQKSGKYYCQGLRDTVVGKIHTLESTPVEINVDGGWAILEIPPHPSLVGDTLKVTCRVRGNPVLDEVFLYKDGVQVMTQKGPKPHFYLTNLTLKDQGTYYCRPSWDIDRKTRSVISSDVPVQVLEVLTQPFLEIVTKGISGDNMKLICHLQYNAPAPAPPINYFFYKDNNRLGIATSENHDRVRKAPGVYSCKAKVPQLGISRWSEPKHFGQVTGQAMMPQPHNPRAPQPLAPTVSSPDLSLPAAAESTATEHSSQQSTAAPTPIQPAEVSTDLSNPFPKPSQSLNHIATTESFNASEESGDMSGDDTKSDESVDMFGNS